MNHLFRLALILLSAWRHPLKMNEVCLTRFRVWPSDLDVLLHMNNGKYLSLMDLGRVDLMARAGGLKKLRRAGIYPVVASEAIKFKKSLGLFQAFVMETTLAGWDEKYIFLRQRFLVGQEVYAEAVIKGRFLKNSGARVSPQELWKVMGIEPLHNQLPDGAAQALAAWENSL